MECEIPKWLAWSIGFGDSLAKAAHHKYVRRVPTGKASPKYRYYYKVTGGHGLGHHSEFVVGAGFKGKSRGKSGHFHITHDHGDGHVTIKHDESGEESKIHKDALSAMLKSEHAEALGAEAKRKESEIADVKAHGSDKQRQRAGLPTRAEEKAAADKAEAERKAKEAAPLKVESLTFKNLSAPYNPGDIITDGRGGHFVVLATQHEKVGSRRSQDYEDMGHFDVRSMTDVQVRRATEEEKARFLAWSARRDRIADVKKRGLEFASGVQWDVPDASHSTNGHYEDWKPPEGSETIHPPGTSAYSPRPRVHFDRKAGQIYLENMGGYDDYRRSLRQAPLTPENETALRDVAAALEGKDVPIEPRPKVDLTDAEREAVKRKPAPAKPPSPTSTPSAKTPAVTVAAPSSAGSDIADKMRGASKVHLHGNTFNAKEDIKRAGGRWNPDKKVWELPVKDTMRGRSELSSLLHSLKKQGVHHTFYKASMADRAAAVAWLRHALGLRPES